MDFFNIIIVAAPVVIFYWAISWEITYYKRQSYWMRYRTFKGKLPMYLEMLAVAVAAIAVALPFILLVVVKPV